LRGQKNSSPTGADKAKETAKAKEKEIEAKIRSNNASAASAPSKRSAAGILSHKDWPKAGRLTIHKARQFLGNFSKRQGEKTMDPER
jgi:hypothetical protein